MTRDRRDITESLPGCCNACAYRCGLELEAENERLRNRALGWLALHVTKGDEDLARTIWESFSDESGL